MDLIRFPTVNPPGEKYGECVDYLADKLAETGMEVRVVEIPEGYLDKHYPYRPLHRSRPRYIVLGRAGRGEVLHFNGHYDVVPPGDGWTLSPFEPLIKCGRIYGRGSTDMKGGIASLLAALKWALEEGLKPGIAVEVALVPDEEAGGLGTRFLVESGLVKARHVVVCEPTTPNRIVVGHKGLVRGVVRVFGRQAHGSSPWRGENAFLKAAMLALEFLKDYEPLLKKRKTRWPVEALNEAYPTVNLGGYAESLSKKDNVVPG